MIRFNITTDAAEPVLTSWEEETVRDGRTPTAVQRMTELRQTYGSTAQISIERTTLIPEADRRRVRFKIVDGDTTMYTEPFPIAEKDARLLAMQAKFPSAVITEEQISG